jgi:hypothetical protein
VEVLIGGTTSNYGSPRVMVVLMANDA